jgi:hypothetical protein
VFMTAFIGAQSKKRKPVAGHVACALSSSDMLVWGGGDGQLNYSSAVFNADKYQWTTLEVGVFVFVVWFGLFGGV